MIPTKWYGNHMVCSSDRRIWKCPCKLFKIFLAANLTLKGAFFFFKALKPVVFTQEMAFIWWNLYRKQPFLRKPEILVSTNFFKTICFQIRIYDCTIKPLWRNRIIRYTFNLNCINEKEWKHIIKIWVSI